MDDELLNPAEVAAKLGVTTGTLATWRYRGKGPACVRLGDGNKARIRYRAADLNRWINQNQQAWARSA